MLFCALSRGVFRGQSMLGHLSLNYSYHSLACAEGDVSLPPTAVLLHVHILNIRNSLSLPELTCKENN